MSKPSLSEKLADKEGIDDLCGVTQEYAAEARALETRVAELEATQHKFGAMMNERLDELHAANARAEAAEAKLERVRAECDKFDVAYGSDYEMGAAHVAVQVMTIIDGEGSDSHE